MIYINYIHYYGDWYYRLDDKPIEKIVPERAAKEWSLHLPAPATEREFKQWFTQTMLPYEAVFNKTRPYRSSPRDGGNGSRPFKTKIRHMQKKKPMEMLADLEEK